MKVRICGDVQEMDLYEIHSADRPSHFGILCEIPQELHDRCVTVRKEWGAVQEELAFHYNQANKTYISEE